jgi:hypothetical protein
MLDPWVISILTSNGTIGTKRITVSLWPLEQKHASGIESYKRMGSLRKSGGTCMLGYMLVIRAGPWQEVNVSEWWFGREPGTKAVSR